MVAIIYVNYDYMKFLMKFGVKQLNVKCYDYGLRKEV